MLETASLLHASLQIDAKVRPRDWSGWTQYLVNRRKPTLVKQLDSPRESPLKWCWPLADSDEDATIVDAIHRDLRKKSGKGGLPALGELASAWVRSLKGRPNSLQLAYEAIAWADATASLAAASEPDAPRSARASWARAQAG